MRIFISHHSRDLDIAHRLADALHNRGLNIYVDRYEFALGDDVLSHLLYSVESSDFVLLLIPSDVTEEARFIRRELNKTLRNKIKSRNISIVPVYLGRRPIFSSFSSPVSFALDRYGSSSSLDRQISRIVDYLYNVPRVDFERLAPLQFEELVLALLRKLHLLDIERIGFNDSGFDLSAKSRMRNPFGGNTFVTWMIEVKFTQSARVDLSLLHRLSHYLEKHPIEINGVVITNGQLTSTAREWLEENTRFKRTSLTVVDGTQLRELVLKYPDLVDTFFS